MKQVTKEQAIDIATNGFWDDKSDIEKFEFQIHNKYLSMDFSEFHRVTEVALGRPVWTHEFANTDMLIAEYEGKDVGATDPFSTYNRIMEGAAG